MGKRIMVLVLLAAAGFSLSGCATVRKNGDLEVQGLRNQVAALEAQLSAKDEELNSLRASVVKASEEQSVRDVNEIKQRPKGKEIQIALRNAGYDPGKIDGKLGKQTIEAIKAFQKANNLPADGKVGKKTWSFLRDYLNKKVK
jgi:peptidoglycan hydrolase-like protein with peptidoglycan-binding domain